MSLSAKSSTISPFAWSKLFLFPCTSYSKPVKLLILGMFGDTYNEGNVLECRSQLELSCLSMSLMKH